MMWIILMICYGSLFLSALLSIIRLILGPSTLDRILAFDAITLCAVGMIVVFSVQVGSVYFLEVLLIFCLLGFVTILAYMDYLSQINKKKTSPQPNDHHDLE